MACYQIPHRSPEGARVTLLKAWFDESAPFPNPVVPSADGLSLVPYTGPDAGQMTVGGELDKLAGNFGAGRDAAGVHWRTDYDSGIAVGEAVAIGVLEEQKALFAEPHSFTFTKFDGTRVTI
ncbi:MAG: hypothetical protein L0206_09220 [Actinobacteria bacterium]|nr:hypothetical protein [Actinomycetota bacterium]